MAKKKEQTATEKQGMTSTCSKCGTKVKDNNVWPNKIGQYKDFLCPKCGNHWWF